MNTPKQTARPRIVMREDIDPTKLRIDWLWKPYVPLRFCSLIGADGGVGKSCFALWLSKQLAEGTLDLPPSQTLFVDFEGMTIDLMGKANAWEIPANYPAFYADIDCGIPIPGPNDVNLIELSAKAVDARLIVIDSWSQLMSDKDYNSQPVVIRQMQPLQMMARNCNAAVLILAHKAKGINIEASQTPSAKSIRGSGSLYEQCRSVMILDQYADGVGFDMHHVKTNLSERAMITSFTRGKEGCLTPIENNLSLQANTAAYRRLALELAREGKSEKEIRKAIKELPEANTMWPTRAIKWLEEQGYRFTS